MRADIQFLRGVAVLAVVLYHAELSWVANGFLGVDVFFVISGFLITSIVLKGLQRKQFSFKVFYLRRAARLLPALCTTLFLTSLLGWVFLTDRQWDDYFHQLLGALTFSSNVVLPFQVGYFEDAAKTKPLLHIWSLSLEEQFYLLLPLLLFLTRAALRPFLLAVLTLLSFSFCQFLLFSQDELLGMTKVEDQDWAFYLLFSRAWELLVGSLAAWCMLRNPRLRLPSPVKWFALAALIALLGTPLDSVALRGDALLAVLLTALLIVGQDDWLPRNRLFKPVERIGDVSYSLYLLHWPLLAFAQVAFLEDVPAPVNYALVVAAFVLSFVQYRMVEQRFRMAYSVERGNALMKGLLVATVGLLLFSAPALVSTLRGAPGSDIDFKEFRRVNSGLNWRCANSSAGSLLEVCQTTESPKVAVWGDSFAMHLIPGLMRNPATEGSLIQFTQSSCNPALGLAQNNRGLERGNSCIAFNAYAVSQIAALPSIRHVVISSPFGFFYRGGAAFIVGGEVVQRDPELAKTALKKAVNELHRAGKSVLLVTPPPSAGFSVGDCLERKFTGAIVLGREDCSIPAAVHRRRLGSVLRALEDVAADTGASVLRLPDRLCDDERCATIRDGVPLWRDRMHLSRRGSEVLLESEPLFQSREE